MSLAEEILRSYRVAEAGVQQEPVRQLNQVGQLQGILQQAQAMQQRQQAIAREDAFRSDLAGLGPNPDQNALAQIAAKYAAPGDVLRTQQSSLDRTAQREAMSAEAAARREAAGAMQQERIAAQAEQARQRSEDQRLTERERNQARMDMVRLAASLRQPPQPRQNPIINTPDGIFERTPDGLVPLKDPTTGKPLKPSGASTEKALPSSLANKYLENIQNLRKADIAAALLEGKDVGDMIGDKDATGKKGLLTNLGVLGDKALNAVDPKGVDTRAMVGDLGSMVIHDRSGAAVTAAEFPRLRPFIPLASDSPEVARKKVKRFAQEYRAEVEAQKEFFGASGYKVPQVGGSGGGNDLGEQVKALGIAYEPEKYDYRIVDGKVQRKAK